MVRFLLCFAALTSQTCCAQVCGSIEIQDSLVMPWTEVDVSKYQYIYHFGESESESDLMILIQNDTLYAQIRSGDWANDGKAWISQYKNLSNVKIIGTIFYSDQTSGEFVQFKHDSIIIYGLKVNSPWNAWFDTSQYEIGYKSYPVSDYHSGKFSYASQRFINKIELEKLPKTDLRIMRNH